MNFQASDLKDTYFLDFLDNNLNSIESLYIKEGPWIRYFGYSNSLCIRAIRAITNYAPIEEYHF